MKIEYKDKVLNTSIYKEVSDDLLEELKKEYYKKPDYGSVLKEIKAIVNGKRKTTPNVTRYFFRDLMSKVTLHHSKWSLEDMFENKEILGHFYGRVEKYPKLLKEGRTLIKGIEKAVQLGGKGMVSKPTDFKLSTVKGILNKYNINNNYHDGSCGWGIRMMGSLISGINYYGTDPNYELIDKLNDLAKMFDSINDFNMPTYHLKPIGSETIVEEWKNKMGVSFTSPPYFKLEDYKIGEQSIKKYNNYKDWLNMFLKKTFENTWLYLVDGGHMLINIKDYEEYDLEQETIRMAVECGFDYVGVETLENTSRISEKKELNNNNENIFVFKKNTKAIVDINDLAEIYSILKIVKKNDIDTAIKNIIVKAKTISNKKDFFNAVKMAKLNEILLESIKE